MYSLVLALLLLVPSYGMFKNPSDDLKCTKYGSNEQLLDMSAQRNSVKIVDKNAKVVSKPIKEKNRFTSLYSFKEEYKKETDRFKYQYILTGTNNEAPYRCTKIYQDKNQTNKLIVRSTLYEANGEHLLSTKCIANKNGIMTAKGKNALACISVSKESCPSYKTALAPLEIESFSEQHQIVSCLRVIQYGNTEEQILKAFEINNSNSSLYIYPGIEGSKISHDQEAKNIQDLVRVDLSAKDRAKYGLKKYTNNFYYPMKWRRKKIPLGNLCSLIVHAHNKCDILMKQPTVAPKPTPRKKSTI